jgi:hypothetical protein
MIPHHVYVCSQICVWHCVLPRSDQSRLRVRNYKHEYESTQVSCIVFLTCDIEL